MKPKNYWKSRGWQWRNSTSHNRCFVLDVWRTRYINMNGQQFCTYDGWDALAVVFRAHRGTHWVYKNHVTNKTHGFTQLRTAMRMAVFLTMAGEKNG